MKIFVTAKPNAKEDRVEKIDDAHFRVWVKAPPDEGRANQALIKTLSEYFNIPKSHFSLLQGASSKFKVLEIQ